MNYQIRIINYQLSKSFLSICLAVSACLFFHAEEAAGTAGNIYYGDAPITGKEYIFHKNPNAQTKIASVDSGCIYIAENAAVYGKENLFVKKSDSPNTAKTVAAIKETAPAHPEKDVSEKEPVIVSPAFPPLSSSPTSFLLNNRESVIVPQHKSGENQFITKAYSVYRYANIENSDLSQYFPEQRQKLSASATQCGMLTSFGANYPPAPERG